MYRRRVEPFGYPVGEEIGEEKTDGMGGTSHIARKDRNFRKLSVRHPYTSSVASRRARSRGREIDDVPTTENAEEFEGDFSWSLQKWYRLSEDYGPFIGSID